MAHDRDRVVDERAFFPANDQPAVDAPLVIHATPYSWRDPTTIAPRQWLYGRHLIGGFVSATVSPGGVGKSSLALVEAVAMASGQNLLGSGKPDPMAVWYLNLEDPRDEIERRLAAVCMQHRIGSDELGGRLYIDSGRDVSIVLAERKGDRVVINERTRAALVAEIRRRQIAVLIVDPFVSSHRVPENDNGAIDLVVKTWARIADEACCAVELIHHTRKPGNGQTELTVDDARGASALIGAVRSARVLNTMSKEDAEQAGIPQEERRRYFRVDDGKSNMQPPRDHAVWRCLVSVDLGNDTPDRPSDHVGVAVEWSPPSRMAGVTVADLDRVCSHVADGEYRCDVQSPAWVGHVVADVMAIDLETDAGKKRVKGVLNAWFASGALAKEWRADQRRQKREFVVVGRGAAPS